MIGQHVKITQIAQYKWGDIAIISSRIGLLEFTNKYNQSWKSVAEFYRQTASYIT